MPAPDTPRRRVLVVDDNTDAADALALFLELSGHEVRVAYDGAQALSAVAEAMPDCILMDFRMPVMDGCEAARRIRQRADARGVVIACVTAYSDGANLARIREAGFDHYLKKPAAPEDVVALLDSTGRPGAGRRTPAR